MVLRERNNRKEPKLPGNKLQRLPLRKMKNQKPNVGTKMYFVQENLYYIKEKAGPILEYCVCEGEVTGFFQVGFTEICLRGYSPKGFRTPYRYKLSDVGKKVFYTAKEAAELAKNMTEKYEQTWGWLGAPEIPMRRTWESLMCDHTEVMP